MEEAPAPAVIVTCSSCGQWQLERGRDRFCSWCGTPLRRIEVVHGATGEGVVRGRLRHHLAGGKGGEGFDLGLSVTGGVPIAIRSISTDAPGVSFRLRGRKNDVERVRVEVDLAALDARRIPVAVETDDGEGDTFDLEILPAPRLEFVPGDPATERLVGQTVGLSFTRPRATGEERRLRLRLRGAPIEPTSIALEGPGAGRLAVGCADVGRELGEGTELSVALSRRGEWSHGDAVEARLVVGVRGRARPLEVPLSVDLSRREGGAFQPERVHWSTVTVGFDTRRGVHFVNEDDYPLAVRAVRPTAPWIEVGWERRGAAGSPARVGAFRLEPGDSRSLVVRLLTEHPEFPKPGSGAIAARIQFDLELDDPARVEIEVTADEVLGARSLAGFLAVDFGTTNTCVAIGGQGAEARVLEIGGDVSIPSVIYFEDVSDPARPRYQVGNKARALVRLGAKEALVKTFKRRLGIDRPERVFDRHGNSAFYTAEELTGFFLEEVIRQAQETIKAEGGEGARIEEVVFTYPVLFSDRQIDCLARVLGQGIGIPRVYRSLDEANAGAIRFLYDDALRELHEGEAEGAPPRTEFALNFDFGGGTIDIALLRLEYDFPGDVVRSTPIGVTGLYRFGGEDVTVVVRDLILERIAERVRRVRIPCGDPDERPGEYEAIRGNNYLLYLLAETVKKAVYSDQARYVIEPDAGFFNDLAVDFGAGLEEIGPTRSLFRGLDDDAARIAIGREEIDSRIEARLGEAIERAYNLWRFTAHHGDFGIAPGSAPDRVLLTGKSSSIPLVASLFARRFGLAADRIVFRPAAAKRVVVEGACFYRQFESAAIEGLEFVVGDAAGRVPVPLGIQKTIHGRPCFSPLFLNGQPMDLDGEASRAAGERVYVAEAVETLRLDRPVVFVKICRNLNYTDEIDLSAGGTEKIGFFEIRREDPFFADWPEDELRKVPCRFRLVKRPVSGRYSLEAIFEKAGGGRRAVEFHFEDSYLAAVPEGQEAAGAL